MLVQQIGQLAARVRAIAVENQRRLVRPLGALERALGCRNQRQRLLPQLLPARAIDRVERLERPAPQLAQLRGLGAAGLGGQRGVVQVPADLPFDRLVAVAGHLRHRHGACQRPAPSAALATSRRRWRAAGSSSSAAMSGAIDGQRCAGSALSPRSTARRIHAMQERVTDVMMVSSFQQRCSCCYWVFSALFCGRASVV